jgi:hypothetical protein
MGEMVEVGHLEMYLVNKDLENGLKEVTVCMKKYPDNSYLHLLMGDMRRELG